MARRELHVVESFATGVLGIVELLANGMAQGGAEVHVAYSRRKETPADFAAQFDQRVVFHELKLARGPSPREDIVGLWHIYQLIKTLNPDVVHVHSSKAGFLGRVAWRLAQWTGQRSRLFYSPHGWSFLQENLGRLERLLYLTLERFAHACGGTIVGCSKGEAEVGLGHVSGGRITWIDNAVNPPERMARPTRTDSKLRIVTSGRICYQKNPALFAEIATALRDEQVEFVWLGTAGEGAGEMEQALRPAVTVTGWLPRKEVLSTLAQSDVYLQTSRWEGMPVSVIEAMMLGLPVVASNVVGNRDIVEDHQTGYLFDDAGEAVEALRELIRNPEQRAFLARRARDAATGRFSPEPFIARWGNLYRGQLEGADGGSAVPA